MVRKALLSTAIAGLAATSLAAGERLAPPVSDESEIGGRATMIAILGLAVIVAGIVVILDDGDEAAPLSP
jgi:hypothetical protein